MANLSLPPGYEAVSAEDMTAEIKAGGKMPEGLIAFGKGFARPSKNACDCSGALIHGVTELAAVVSKQPSGMIWG